MKFLAALAAASQRRLQRFAIQAALACVCALSAMIGLGFATYALFLVWEARYGIVNAAIGLSAIYLIVAGILYLCYRRAGMASSAQPAASAPGGASIADIEALKAAGVQAGAASQAAALAAGVELAKQLTPLQLMMLSAISGFVAGRKL